MHPEESPNASSQAGTAPSHLAENSLHDSVVSLPSSPQGTLSPDEQDSAGPEAEAVGGILPEVWAELLQTEVHLVNPLLPWLRQELQAICGPRWWQACHAEARILHTLCVSGPVAEALVQVLQPDLGEHAAPLVHGIINIIVDQCSQEVLRLLLSHAVEEEDNRSAAGSSSTSSSSTSSSPTSSSPTSPTSSQSGTPTPHRPSSTSPESSNGEEEASSSAAALRGGPGRPRSVPIPEEQEQPQEEPGQAAVAGPSARGCRRSHSDPSCGRDCSTGGSRRPPKRRASSLQDSP